MSIANPQATRKLPVSVLIMTQNEEANISYALDSVRKLFDEIIVVDSFSTDKTMDIINTYPEVKVFQNRFIDWATQRMWMLEHCAVTHDVVFFLDADEYVTPAFARELDAIVSADIEFGGIEVKPVYVFLGAVLRFAYGHPRVRRIFNKRSVKFRGEGAREYSDRTGRQLTMREPLMHCDRKPIEFWIRKHIENAEREATLFVAFKKGEIPSSRRDNKLTRKIRGKLWLRERIWSKLPLFLRPLLYFAYRYIFQLGVLDGRAGLVYCVLHGLWYPMLIDAKIFEKETTQRFP